MAFADDLAAIRDSMSSELKGEFARRAAIVAAGNPAPTTYSVGNKNFSWNEYVSTMLGQISDLNQKVIEAGGDGGLIEQVVRAYS